MTRCANPECARWVPETCVAKARFCCRVCQQRVAYLRRLAVAVFGGPVQGAERAQ